MSHRDCWLGGTGSAPSSAGAASVSDGLCNKITVEVKEYTDDHD
jgi:hypothetical protein